ncbi:hypothetical protein [Anabaenopsis arnoldii]|uniref:Uncharacterized protein n=1 Tax=Anabaenopsis arnoldii TaxID=2152938 RepID=A0ABT5AUG8_9CYAN|nr:hypothetical protein [Anabaenopsis arnoldii]MDB9540337.1 hypothetical protein [Anabaenopsis arnoldii]MDH6092735.1 hypothetical protein [Anabaenopsis arnoldii]
MANIKIFEINEDGELIVNDPELADALQELTPQELEIRGGLRGNGNCQCINNNCPKKVST